jgi:uncharacterized protein YqhQ
MIEVKAGIVAMLKDGSLVIFPDGNHGEDNECLRFVNGPRKKELSRLVAWPGLILEDLKELEAKVANLEAFLTVRCLESDYEYWLDEPKADKDGG